MALPRTSSSRGAGWWPRGADGRRQRRRGRAGVGLPSLAEPGARAATIARQEDAGSRDPQGGARTCHGVKKTAAAAAVAAEGRFAMKTVAEVIGVSRSNLIECGHYTNEANSASHGPRCSRVGRARTGRKSWHYCQYSHANRKRSGYSAAKCLVHGTDWREPVFRLTAFSWTLGKTG